MATIDDGQPLFDVQSPTDLTDPDELYGDTPIQYQYGDVIRFTPRFTPTRFRLLVLRFVVYPRVPSQVIVRLQRPGRRLIRTVSALLKMRLYFCLLIRYLDIDGKIY